MTESKICVVCKVEKPLTEFHKNGNKRFRDGLANDCKECSYKRTRKYVEANREKSKEYQRAYNNNRYANDPEFRNKKKTRVAKHRKTKDAEFAKNRELYEKHREYQTAASKKHYAENREAILAKSRTPEKKAQQRAAFLKKHYGLTVEQFEKLLARNHGRCWICDKDNAKGRSGKPVVDHCHDSKKVRGILCDWCNTMLGALGDTIQKLQESMARFVKYLEAAEKLDINDL